MSALETLKVAAAGSPQATPRDRWWSAPMRFTSAATAALRDARRSRLWLDQAPIGIRTPLGTPS